MQAVWELLILPAIPGIDEFHEDVIKMKEFTNNKPFIVNISLVPDLTKGEEIFKYIDVCAKEGVAATSLQVLLQ